MAGLPVFLAGVAAGAVTASVVALFLAGGARRREARRLSRLAHDLRAPLTSIASFAEILEDHPADGPRYLGVILEEAARLDRMIGEGLGARGGAGSGDAPRGPGVAGAPAATTGRRVLVVDDDRYIVEATLALLSRAGFQALGAAGGEEALRRARAERPDLILMDLMMPGLPGDEALRRLRSDPSTRDIPVIITSGEQAAAGLEGAAAVLTKPISREALLSAVARAMPGGR